MYSPLIFDINIHPYKLTMTEQIMTLLPLYLLLRREMKAHP